VLWMVVGSVLHPNERPNAREPVARARGR
jgi:hypothetical protein